MEVNRAYKRFVDELVDISKFAVSASRIRDHGHPERTNNDAMPYDQSELEKISLFSTFSSKQKEVVAKMLLEERHSAVHDVASFLEGLLSSDGMRISWNGEDVPSSPYASMHYDYVCQREGDAWPDEVCQ
jgi:hypothetical protein